MELNDLTIKEIRKGLIKKEFSAEELSEAYLDKIEKENDEIFAYLEICRVAAIDQAKAIDKNIEEGEDLAPLAGIPMAVKDNIMVEGVKCTCGSRILENYIAPYDATVIKKNKR